MNSNATFISVSLLCMINTIFISRTRYVPCITKPKFVYLCKMTIEAHIKVVLNDIEPNGWISVRNASDSLVAVVVVCIIVLNNKVPKSAEYPSM